jgi:hypothetical protein
MMIYPGDKQNTETKGKGKIRWPEMYQSVMAIAKTPSLKASILEFSFILKNT